MLHRHVGMVFTLFLVFLVFLFFFLMILILIDDDGDNIDDECLFLFMRMRMLVRFMTIMNDKNKTILALIISAISYSTLAHGCTKLDWGIWVRHAVHFPLLFRNAVSPEFCRQCFGFWHCHCICRICIVCIVIVIVIVIVTLLTYIGYLDAHLCTILIIRAADFVWIDWVRTT